MQLISELFITPLRSEDPYRSYLNEQQFKVLFSDLEVIRNINTVLLAQLESRIGGEFDPATTKLGDIFIQIVRNRRSMRNVTRFTPIVVSECIIKFFTLKFWDVVPKFQCKELDNALRIA